MGIMGPSEPCWKHRTLPHAHIPSSPKSIPCPHLLQLHPMPASPPSQPHPHASLAAAIYVFFSKAPNPMLLLT